jgi:hypothetical protein
MAWNLDQVLQQLKMARSELKEIQCQSWETHDEGLHQHLQKGEAKSMDSTDPHVVGKEMPISRIVIAVPNATVVLLD